MKILSNFERIFRFFFFFFFFCLFFFFFFFFCFFVILFVILNGVLDTKMEGRKLFLETFLSDCNKGLFLKGDFAKSPR